MLKVWYRYIAIIDVDDDSLEYPYKSSYIGFQRCTFEQLVIDIMDSQDEQTIDYIIPSLTVEENKELAIH